MNTTLMRGVLISVLLSATCHAGQKNKSGGELTKVKEFIGIEKQITFEPRNHVLAPWDVWSRNNQWVVYDTRRGEGGMGSNSNIEKVNVDTGEIVVLYETSDQTEFGPGCGTASYSPVEDKVVFIHGLRNCNAQRPYGFWRRTAVAVDEARPGEPIFIDARDVTHPFTPGSLRGGTHAHEWSGDGKWIGFTYNDAVMAELEKRTGMLVELRTIGVATGHRAVQVDGDSEGENVDGIWFSALVVRVVPDPKPGSDEIKRAYNDSWIGTKGYQKPDGRWQRARAFQGKVIGKQGKELSEVFVVDVPERIDIPGELGPLEGTPTTFPMPPKGARQRRLTFTEDRTYPGIAQEPRHWLRSTADGSRISYLAQDHQGMNQVFFVSPLEGKPIQVTHHESSVQTTVSWSPDGEQIAYACDNSIYICHVAQGASFGRTTRVTDRSEQPPGIPIWSRDGKKIAFTRKVHNGRNLYFQIFILDLNSSGMRSQDR